MSPLFFAVNLQIGNPFLRLSESLPKGWQVEGLVLETWQWLGLLVLIVSAWAIGKLFRFMARFPIRHALRRRGLFPSEDFQRRMFRRLDTITIALVWSLSVPWLLLPKRIEWVALLVVKTLLVYGLVRLSFYLIDLFSEIWAKRAFLTPSRFDDLMVPFLEKGLKIAAICLGIVMVVDFLGISPASLLAGLGIGGLAVALAAQDTVKNLFGSLTVVLDRPFEIGDDIRIGSDILGTVEEVGFRSTRIRTFENTLITVPNGNLISATVDALGKRTAFRHKCTFYLHPENNALKIHAFKEGLIRLAEQHSVVRPKGISASIQGFSPTSIELFFSCHFMLREESSFIERRHELFVSSLVLAGELGLRLTGTLAALQPPLSEASYAEALLKAEQEGQALAESLKAKA